MLVCDVCFFPASACVRVPLWFRACMLEADRQTELARCRGDFQRSSLRLVFNGAAGAYHSDVIGYTLYFERGK